MLGGIKRARIFSAIAQGNARRVRDLMRPGGWLSADPSKIRGKFERTPLHEAALRGGREVARALLEAGAEPNARDWRGRTALHLAVGEGDAGMAEELALAGADLWATDEDDRSPMEEARRCGRAEVAAAMLKGAWEGGRSQKGTKLNSQMLRAAVDGQIEVCAALLEFGADPSAKYQDGDAPLHVAAGAAQGRLVSLLLEAGADIGALGQEGLTAEDLAMMGAMREELRAALRGGEEREAGVGDRVRGERGVGEERGEARIG